MLTSKQRQTLEAIKEYKKNVGELPSVRCLAAQINVSTRAAQQQIDVLKRKGYLLKQKPATCSYKLAEDKDNNRLQPISILGSIAAGAATPMFQDQENSICVDPIFFGDSKNIFALKVNGQSMIGDHINDGDIAIIERCQTINSNDILAVTIDNSECTLKRLIKKNETIELIPSNPHFETLAVNEERVCILGRYIGLIRQA